MPASLQPVVDLWLTLSVSVSPGMRLDSDSKNDDCYWCLGIRSKGFCRVDEQDMSEL